MPRHPLGDKPMTDAERQRRRRERLRQERGPAPEAELSASEALTKARQEIAALRRQLAVAVATEAKVQFTKAQQAHVDTAIRRRARELEKEHAAREAQLEHHFREEVIKRCNENEAKRFPLLQERENRAFEREEYWRKMMNNHKPIFNETEFNIIRACLHPDNSASEDKRKTAFMAVNVKKLQLTGKK